MDMCTRCMDMIVKKPDSISTGYAVDKRNQKLCFSCCAELDEEEMKNTGKTRSLYLNRDETKVTNWPGTLQFNVCTIRKWKVNGFGRMQPVRLAYFNGPDHKLWSIRVQGNMDCGKAIRLKKQ